MHELVEFLPERASAPEWARYHAFRRVQQAEWRPDEPLPPDEVEEVRLKRPNPNQIEHRYQVLDGDVLEIRFNV